MKCQDCDADNFKIYRLVITPYYGYRVYDGDELIKDEIDYDGTPEEHLICGDCFGKYSMLDLVPANE